MIQKTTLAAILFALTLTSCATGVTRIDLMDPLPVDPAPEASAPGSVPLVLGLRKLRDDRADISCLGAKKNAWGATMGKVDLEEGVVFLDLFGEHLTSCFAQAGYELVDHRPTGDETALALHPGTEVEVEVRTFWVEFMPGVFVVDAASKVQIDVNFLEAGSGRELWTQSFRGEGEESSALGVTASMYETSLNAAYAQAMGRLLEALREPSIRALVEARPTATSP